MTESPFWYERGKLRVLLCVDSLGVGGKERQAVELVKGLVRSDGIDCRVVCFDNADFYLRDLEASGITVHFAARQTRWDPSPFLQVRAHIRAHRPHVIHTNGLVSSFYALPLARSSGVPVINGSIRNAFRKGGYRWFLERFLLLMSDYRVANSAAGLRSRYLSEADRRNIVIYNGFDFRRVEQTQGDDAAGPSLDGRVQRVGMVAEFNQYKDYLTFLEAARLLRARHPRAIFLTVGDGPTLAACHEAARDVPTIQFLGKRTDVERIVETFDVGVLSTFVEGLSNSVMEYMAAGKPVVATDGGGMNELVVDGETGILVPPSNPRRLAAAIEYLLDRPHDAARMGQAGHARLRALFPLTRMTDETTVLYRRAARSTLERESV